MTERPYSRIVAANIKRLRLEHGWTQAEFGQRFGGRSEAVVSAIERTVAGKRETVFPIDDVVRIAELFGVTVQDLVTPIPPCACCNDKPPAGMTCLVCGADGPAFS